MIDNLKTSSIDVVIDDLKTKVLYIPEQGIFQGITDRGEANVNRVSCVFHTPVILPIKRVPINRIPTQNLLLQYSSKKSFSMTYFCKLW